MAYDRMIENADVDAFISFDTENIGSHMVNEVVKAAPSGNYVILGGSLIDANMPIIADGIKAELAKHPSIQIVAEVYCENWSSTTAFAQLSAILEENQDIQAVLCGNDSLAVGAIRALSEYQLAGKVAVSGQDADLESCQRIVEGTQTMTVYKPLDTLAQKAAQVAVGMCRGEKVDGAEDFYDGTYTIARYMVPTVSVTEANILDTVVADGFHILEEVYRHVPPDEWPDQPPAA